MEQQYRDLKRILTESVAHAFDHSEPKITADIIAEIDKRGDLPVFIASLIDAARSAVEWGSSALEQTQFGSTVEHIVFGPRPSALELDAIAFASVLDALTEIVPPEGAIAIAQATITRWFDLSPFDPEAIPTAIYETAREMGLSMRTAKSVQVLDEAQDLLGHFFTF